MKDEKQIDSTRYETLRLMLDIILSYDIEIDDSLGFKRGVNKMPINVKIAMNTLIEYGVLTESN